MTYTVYALFDEREPAVVRYVGFSRQPEIRWRQHIEESRRQAVRSHRLKWIKKVRQAGARVLWRTLFVVGTAEEAAQAEITAIRGHLEAGHPLVNGTEGGEGTQGFGGNMAPEALARRVATMQTPEYLAERSANSARYWSTDETRDHQREQMEAFWASPEAEAVRARNSEFAKRQHLEATYRGGARTPEAREKMAAAKLGKPHARQRTPEWNAKIAASNLGKKHRPWTDEERERRKPTAETRAKMSAAAKARHAKPAKTED